MNLGNLCQYPKALMLKIKRKEKEFFYFLMEFLAFYVVPIAPGPVTGHFRGEPGS